MTNTEPRRLSGYHQWKCPVCGTRVAAPGLLAFRHHLARVHKITKDLQQWIAYARPVQDNVDLHVPGLALSEFLAPPPPPLLEDIVEAEVVDEY